MVATSWIVIKGNVYPIYLIGLTVADVQPEICSGKQVKHYQVILAAVLLLLLLLQEVLGRILQQLDGFFATVNWRAGTDNKYLERVWFCMRLYGLRIEPLNVFFNKLKGSGHFLG